MKLRYTLLWSHAWREWICIDISKKPEGMTVREYFLSSFIFELGINYKYLTN